MHVHKHPIKIIVLLSIIVILSYTFSIAFKFSFAYPLSYIPHNAIDWNFVTLNIILFSLFLLFIPLKRKTTRLPGSIYFAPTGHTMDVHSDSRARQKVKFIPRPSFFFFNLTPNTEIPGSWVKGGHWAIMQYWKFLRQRLTWR